MSNSCLINFDIPSPNNSGKRFHKIDTITIHHMAGNMSAENCGYWFQRPTTRASSNYGIDSDGLIGLYVDEGLRSWATSSRSNDDRAVTIEVANCGGDPDWPVSDKAYEALIRLVADICKRNNIKELKWRADPSLIGHVDQQNMTVHRWFAPTGCPGNYLYSHMGDIANRVNELLKENCDCMVYKTFGDLKAHESEEAVNAVQKMIDNGILVGSGGDGDCRVINLCECSVKLITLLARAGVPGKYYHTLADLKRDKNAKWYVPMIETLLSLGFVNGKGGSGDDTILDYSEEDIRLLVTMGRAFVKANIIPQVEEG